MFWKKIGEWLFGKKEPEKVWTFAPLEKDCGEPGCCEDFPAKVAPEDNWINIPVKPKEDPKPLVIPNPADLYKTDQIYLPYSGPVEEGLKELFDTIPEAVVRVPLDEAPPSLDYLNVKPVEEIFVPADPLVEATARRLTEVEEYKSSVTPPKRKDPLVSATAKAITEQKRPKKKKVEVPKKADKVESEFALLLKQLAEEEKPKKKAVKKATKKKLPKGKK